MELWWLLPTILLGGPASWFLVGALTFRLHMKVFDPHKVLFGKAAGDEEVLFWAGPFGLFVYLMVTFLALGKMSFCLILKLAHLKYSISKIPGVALPKKFFLWVAGDELDPKKRKLLQDSDINSDSLKKLPEGIGADSDSSV